MFEAKLVDGSILKRIVEAIKDVVNDVNIDVSPSGKILHLSKAFNFTQIIQHFDSISGAMCCLRHLKFARKFSK